MIYVLFEVVIKEEFMDEYFSLAADLKKYLENCDGFIRSERFSSLIFENKILSLSVWKNEETVSKWHKHTKHRINQNKGKNLMFQSYTITVTSQIRQYGKNYE
ncbi:antibiotic biosynthesis monooxygenase family protein [Methanobrevibacter sp. DSM 116169]|uniref:antibiotic biosynthesis monooxygenase family protein n=1 Tax=Methanobrevibacter sp. DSM 116169 TaxID=3242727 RepID=UPI0038FD3090